MSGFDFEDQLNYNAAKRQAYDQGFAAGVAAAREKIEREAAECQRWARFHRGEMNDQRRQPDRDASQAVAEAFEEMERSLRAALSSLDKEATDA